jgi:hypothetical protein
VTEADSCAGDLGRHRRICLNPNTVARLGLSGGDLVELIGANPVPLRGWVEVAENAAEDHIAVDVWGQGVLSSGEGTEVMLRPVRRRQPTDPPLAGRPVEKRA